LLLPVRVALHFRQEIILQISKPVHMLLSYINCVSIYILCIFVIATPPNGMALFCFENEILKIGIEIKSFYVKAFYNIGSEKNWIFSAMDQSKGTMTFCVMAKR
jgi:hypothetical protein